MFGFRKTAVCILRLILTALLSATLLFFALDAWIMSGSEISITEEGLTVYDARREDERDKAPLYFVKINLDDWYRTFVKCANLDEASSERLKAVEILLRSRPLYTLPSKEAFYDPFTGRIHIVDTSYVSHEWVHWYLTPAFTSFEFWKLAFLKPAKTLLDGKASMLHTHALFGKCSN